MRQPYQSVRKERIPVRVLKLATFAISEGDASFVRKERIPVRVLKLVQLLLLALTNIFRQKRTNPREGIETQGGW